MSERIACCIPFCRRTISRAKLTPATEWICGRHWSAVPRMLRAEYALAKRRARKILARRPVYREWWKLKGGSPERLRAVAMWQRIDSLWERCKAAATERAGGIA